VDIREKDPMIVYDNRCYLCVKFAKIIQSITRGNITMIGHYSEFGINLRKTMLGESATEMFWLIDKKTAYGGRSALLPLLRVIITKNERSSNKIKVDDKCEQECKTIKAVFIRTSSLFSNGKKIDL
jgi:predicted DCC family thiol-disulfide oxidoreductase YuxK